MSPSSILALSSGRQRFFLGALAALWMLLSPIPVLGEDVPSAGGQDSRQVRIGVLAKRGSKQCLDKWGPTAAFLNREIPGYSFTIVPLGFDEILLAAEGEDVEFVLANSSFYVDLEVRYGARRIATLNNLYADGISQKVFAGVIFCRADRQDIRTAQDLENKVVMAVDERSLGGWHMAWRKLKEQGIDPQSVFAELVFGGSHDAVILAVGQGTVDVGCVRSDALERMAHEGKIKLDDFRLLMPHEGCDGEVRFLHSTAHYPEWPMAKFPHTSEGLAEDVAIALMGMPTESVAARAAKCAGWTIPQNYRPVHELLMALQQPPYQDYGKVTVPNILRQFWPWILGIFVLSSLVVLFVVRAARMNAKLEQAMRVREERERGRAIMQTVLDSLPTGVLVVEAGSRTIREVNPAAAGIIGLPVDEIIGQQCHRFICPDKIGQCPILDLGQKIDQGEHELVTAHRGRIAILKTVVPIMLEGKKHLLESFLDITERKLAEAERERMMHAIEQVADTIVITDEAGTIQYVNPAFEDIAGYTRGEAIGRNPRILRSGKQDQAFYREMWETLTRGETWSGQIINKKQDGSLFTERVTISPVRDAAGQTVNYVAVKRDITAELKLEEQFRQAQKMESIGRLAGGVAHDFNNMLGVILGYTEIIMGQVDKSDPVHDSLTEILTATERSVEVTRQLLAFARKQTVAPQVFDLSDAVGGMRNMLRRLIGEDVELVWLPAPEACPVKLDPSQADQILANLCLNARDAIQGGGKIIIETGSATFDAAYCRDHAGAELGDYVLLTVSDDGCGMERDTLENIYEPFYTTKERGKGTGLGLATVYGIVKQNDGFINVYSELGQGTVFRIYLPRHALGTDQSRGPVQVPSAERGHETILLVEDEPAFLDMITKMLERQGYTVLAAASPNEAIGLAGESGPFHLLLTDVVMPEMNGRDLAARLQTDFPDLKCLFMSGYTANVIAHHGVLDEGVHFIQKPFVTKDLAAKVRLVLDNDLENPDALP